MKKIFLILLLVCGYFCQGQAQQRTEFLLKKLQQPSAPYVLFGAHRGDWRNAPENSLQAIQRCIDMGLDIVEIDLRSTSDGHLIIMHDKTLDRTTTGSGKISEHTLEEISKLYLKNPLGIVTRQKVPTVQDALALTRGKILVFLDKAESYIPELSRVLDSMDIHREVILFGREQLSYEAQLKVFGNLVHTTCFIPVLKSSMQDIPAYIKELDATIKPVAYALEFDEDTAVLKQVSAIKQTGAKIWISTLWGSMCGGHDDELSVDNPAQGWGWVLDKKADIILTDRPSDMKHYLEKKKRHNSKIHS